MAMSNVLFSADPVNINNEPCLLGISIDITEREKEANALRQSEKNIDRWLKTRFRD